MAVLLEVAGASNGLSVVEVLLANPGVRSVGVRVVGVALPVQVLTVTGVGGVGQSAGSTTGRGKVLGPRKGIAGQTGIPGEGGRADVGTGAVLAVKSRLLIGGEAGCGRGGGSGGGRGGGRGRGGHDDDGRRRRRRALDACGEDAGDRGGLGDGCGRGHGCGGQGRGLQRRVLGPVVVTLAAGQGVSGQEEGRQG